MANPTAAADLRTEATSLRNLENTDVAEMNTAIVRHQLVSLLLLLLSLSRCQSELLIICNIYLSLYPQMQQIMMDHRMKLGYCNVN